MELYKQFQCSHIDLSPLGLEKGPVHSDYFCTPKGAEIIGWTGVDGIHFCLIKGFREVFSVNPMNPAGENVHPVSRNFTDFLCLLLSCKGEAAIEQAHGWSREQFQAFQEENPVTPEQELALEKLQRAFSQKESPLAPLENPFDYIKELQREFDYGSIPFRREYFRLAGEEQAPPEPKWKVCYEGGFWGKGRGGEEVPLGQTFSWGGNVWHIPSVYRCGAGLVVDCCIEAGAFEGTEGQQKQAENQFWEMDFEASVEINGKTSNRKTGYGTAWRPAESLDEGEQPDQEAGRVLKHYGLPLDRKWIIRRESFPWAVKTKPKIKSLKLSLSPRAVPISGTTFQTPQVGESVILVHPVTGTEHRLTVEKWEPAEMDGRFLDKMWNFPRFFYQMTYTLDPDLPGSSFNLQDLAEGDSPVREGAAEEPAARSSPATLNPDLPGRSFNLQDLADGDRPVREAAAEEPAARSSPANIGIIGGASGPTAIFITGRGKEDAGFHIACSSCRFQRVPPAEWQAVFWEKPCGDIQVTLLE